MPGGWDGCIEGCSEEGEGSFSEDAEGLTMTTNLAQGPLPLCPTHNIGLHSTLNAWDQLWGTYNLRRTEEKYVQVLLLPRGGGFTFYGN